MPRQGPCSPGGFLYRLTVYKYPLEQVQIWSGIKWPSIVQRYKRNDPAEQRQMINKWHPLK